MPEEITLEDYNEIKALAQINTVQRDQVHRIVNAYKRFVINRYVCPNCPGAIWEALKSLKDLHGRIAAGWEAEIIRLAVEDYKQNNNNE